jgi:hypothetical protein
LFGWLGYFGGGDDGDDGSFLNHLLCVSSINVTGFDFDVGVGIHGLGVGDLPNVANEVFGGGGVVGIEDHDVAVGVGEGGFLARDMGLLQDLDDAFFDVSVEGDFGDHLIFCTHRLLAVGVVI